MTGLLNFIARLPSSDLPLRQLFCLQTVGQTRFTHLAFFAVEAKKRGATAKLIFQAYFH
jgi:hypothetical protein